MLFKKWLALSVPCYGRSRMKPRSSESAALSKSQPESCKAENLSCASQKSSVDPRNVCLCVHVYTENLSMVVAAAESSSFNLTTPTFRVIMDWILEVKLRRMYGVQILRRACWDGNAWEIVCIPCTLDISAPRSVSLRHSFQWPLSLLYYSF